MDAVSKLLERQLLFGLARQSPGPTSDGEAALHQLLYM